ncbi:D-aminoacyl-tRNA deacylase [Arcanobacterium pinnipediorum]|uniref:D-aminoacyl-tRNA deacylase n=1 Tax=Arcanobacterium pinnipediorum TaxID=1503041 RepID=A0ABY5AHX3_9ACTO|nr:D-aminoacyl-tRNA deacylase [Arcanobacterium pinnipediorum]USR79600.1 D-aminoacyl-tRNA deacylase [Arcanobacterium pinnipediorum]
MRAVIQRVKHATVRVERDGNFDVVGSIGSGLAVLVGITHDDGEAQIAKLAKKIAHLKIMRSVSGSDDPKDRVSLSEAGGAVLLVSQFTLYADVRKGTKPSWSHAAPGSVAQPIFQQLLAAVRSYGLTVETGQFGAMMDVELLNDGPFTIVADI